MALHLWIESAFYDARLTVDPDLGLDKQYDFSVKRREILEDALWQEAISSQPWSPSLRRRELCQFLLSKLLRTDRQLQLEALHGLWELSTNRNHHSDISSGAITSQLFFFKIYQFIFWIL